jgi:hypothetical protein
MCQTPCKIACCVRVPVPSRPTPTTPLHPTDSQPRHGKPRRAGRPARDDSNCPPAVRRPRTLRCVGGPRGVVVVVIMIDCGCHLQQQDDQVVVAGGGGGGGGGGCKYRTCVLFIAFHNERMGARPTPRAGGVAGCGGAPASVTMPPRCEISIHNASSHQDDEKGVAVSRSWLCGRETGKAAAASHGLSAPLGGGGGGGGWVRAKICLRET